MLRNLDTIYLDPDLVRISQPKLISARTFFWFTEVASPHAAATYLRDNRKQSAERFNVSVMV